MKKLLTLITVLLVLLCAEGKVIIKGKLVNSNFKGSIYYNEPLNGFINMFYNDKSVLLKKDSTFLIETQLQKEGFMVIRLPGKMLQLFVQPNDTLSFEAHFAVDSQQRMYTFKNIHFTGDNAPGHKEFTSSASNNNLQGFLVSNIFSQKMTAQQFPEQLLLTIQHLLHPFDSLYNYNLIDKKFYEVVAADIKSRFSYELLVCYSMLLMLKEKEGPQNNMYKHFYDALAINSTIFTDDRLLQTKTFLYKRFNPFDPSIPYSFIGKHYTSQYTKDLQDGLASAQISYDSSFAHLKEITHYGYLNGPFLESLWQSHLYWTAATEPDGHELEKQLHLFSTYFPTSAFLPYLTERLEKAIKDRGLSKKVNPDIKFIGNKNFTSLSDLVEANFKGEYVFVDLWATWCSPCIQDFMFKNELKVFLQEKRIVPLYISIDQASDKDRWQTFVYTKELQGYHILASDAFVKDIQKKLYKNGEVMIPRYLLINKTGEVIGTDLPRPSDTEKLKILINQLLLSDLNRKL